MSDNNNTNPNGLVLTESQRRVLKQLTNFVFESDDRVFILKGYAGTGKTTLMRFLINKLREADKSFMLLAPTGRAAKVLSNLSGAQAQTIHSMIYSFSELNKDLSEVEENKLNIESTGQLFLNFEPVEIDKEDTPTMVYIVDESSMVADTEIQNITQAKFGSGKLLSELLAYDERPESKFIFVGDPCQLPPVDEFMTPALLPDYFEQNFGIKAQEASLTEIMRQQSDNDLIRASHLIRKSCALAPDDESYYKFQTWTQIPLRNNPNTQLHKDMDDMVMSYLGNVKACGFNDSIFVCQSNRKCAAISDAVRQSLGFGGGYVVKGDLLMVVQNNYPTGLMNGDMVEVLNIDNREEYRVGLIFRKVVVRELFTGESKSALLLASTLTSQTLNLSWSQQTELFIDFVIRMRNEGIDQKSDAKRFNKAMMNDPYLNALRCMYGYAVTCHKAQGGEWENVYVDFGNMALNPTKAKLQWIYTAVTRAKKTLHTMDKLFIQ